MVIIELVFGIVLIVGIVGGITVNNYLKVLRENQGQIRVLERQFGARLARLEAMEERIAVLEKIVTDRRYTLDQQFRDLESRTG
ncbi:MAG: hypothetical protein HKN84_04905 [Gammaproteobacteria bacterium]|nr:hypothetical protein [Gammaproteobacteria bacterium]